MPGEQPVPPAMVNELLTDGPLAILGVGWTVPEAGGCVLRVRRVGHGSSPASSLLPVVGLSLNYRADPGNPRHCVGHRSPRRNDGRYLDCPNRPQPNEKTCVSCAVADAAFAADLHHAHTRDKAEIHQTVRRHLDQTNVLYLATFRDGSIKIGTSTTGRRFLRWIEQGAWLVAEVATTNDGFEVRRLEDLITDHLGFPQSVTAARKARGMIRPRSNAELTSKLNKSVAQVHELLEPLTNRASCAPSAEPTDGGSSAELTDERWSFPDHDDPSWDRLHPYPVPLTEGQHHLQIEVACGRLAVFTKPNGTDRFVIDLGQLAGRQITLGSYTPEDVMIQDSLF